MKRYLGKRSFATVLTVGWYDGLGKEIVVEVLVEIEPGGENATILRVYNDDATQADRPEMVPFLSTNPFAQSTLVRQAVEQAERIARDEDERRGGR